MSEPRAVCSWLLGCTVGPDHSTSNVIQSHEISQTVRLPNLQQMKYLEQLTPQLMYAYQRHCAGESPVLMLIVLS